MGKKNKNNQSPIADNQTDGAIAGNQAGDGQTPETALPIADGKTPEIPKGVSETEFEALVKERLVGGYLSRKQAVECVKAQLAHDASQTK